MIDGPSPIDPLLAEGPRAPMDTLRPAASLQRVLLLDGGEPLMADLATGDIRRWENGPPLSVPCVSTPFELSLYTRIQVQVLRDPRPSSVDLVLLSMNVGHLAIDVVETTQRRLEIRSAPGGLPSATTAIGESPAIVIVIEPAEADGTKKVTISARNAETAEVIQSTVPCPQSVATLTIGGPSTSMTGRYGRRRLTPVHLEVVTRGEPIDQFRRVARRARRVITSIRRRS